MLSGVLSLVLLSQVAIITTSASSDVVDPQTCSNSDENGCAIDPKGTNPRSTINLDAVSVVCEDENESCGHWSLIGECDKNPGYMLKSCRFSCKVCDPDPIDYGVEQEMEGSTNEEAFNKAMEEMEKYLQSSLQDPWMRRTIPRCKCDHKHCVSWKVRGECETNSKYMKKSCPAACQTCHLLTVETRCPIRRDGSMPDAWQTGDLDEFFVNLTTKEEYQHFEPKILSRPEPSNTTKPWVVILENVLSDDEADRLIELGHQRGYERSSDVGNMRFDGSTEKNVNEGRTSENSWCKGSCMKDPLAISVVEKIEYITGVPSINSEYLQLLKYEVGQKYDTHHDYIDYQQHRAPGPRILTVFLYLNDVPKGGGTNFPLLVDEFENGLTVMPKKGRVLIWPSVLNEDPNLRDSSTHHQALPVEEGQKFGANAWVHLRDFKTPHKEGCH